MSRKPSRFADAIPSSMPLVVILVWAASRLGGGDGILYGMSTNVPLIVTNLLLLAVMMVFQWMYLTPCDQAIAAVIPTIFLVLVGMILLKGTNAILLLITAVGAVAFMIPCIADRIRSREQRAPGVHRHAD